MKERVQKILARAGLASRRGAEELIRAGRVTADGRVVELGEQVDPARVALAVDGRSLPSEPLVYWLLHKPRGVLTTVRDPRGRPTVVGLLPKGVPRVFPVGRLDRDTEGLVLLTNDGALAHALLHPSLGSERVYRVTARGRMSRGALRQLARGVLLDDGLTAPAHVEAVRFDERRDNTSLTLTLREGRKRQIRRALQALGHPVVRLVRTRMGPLSLGRLECGRARALRRAEVGALRRHAARLEARAAARAQGRPTGRPPGEGGAPPGRLEAKAPKRRGSD